VLKFPLKLHRLLHRADILQPRVHGVEHLRWHAQAGIVLIERPHFAGEGRESPDSREFFWNHSNEIKEIVVLSVGI